MAVAKASVGYPLYCLQGLVPMAACARSGSCWLCFCLSAPDRPPPSLGLRIKLPSAVRGDFEGANQSTSPGLEASKQMGDWKDGLLGGRQRGKRCMNQKEEGASEKVWW